MAAHTEEQRVFIVRRLAMFDSYSEIAVAFALRFPDTTCALADIETNDPRRCQLDDKLNAIFNARRAQFVADNAVAAPTSDKTVRLIELHNMFKIARDRNALDLAAEILEQIAKETSGFYAGKNGAAPAAADIEPVSEITYTVVDPKADAPA